MRQLKTEERTLTLLATGTFQVRSRAGQQIVTGAVPTLMIAEEVKKRLAKAGYNVKVVHRDSPVAS